MGSALRFRYTDVPRQKGELARLKVVQGPDYGSIYVITGPKATIGRGEENDIVITDLKSSRSHAEFLKLSSGWSVKDKKSANGILHNGKTTNEAKLALNDTVTLGETTLEFVTADVGTTFLVAPVRSMDQVLSDQKKQQEGDLFGGISKLISGIKSSAAAASAVPSGDGGLLKNRRVLIIAAGALLLFLLFGSNDEPEKPKKKKADSASRDLASYLPKTEPNKIATQVFKDGLREYFNGNYNRARVQFETVLQITPGHPLATLYLENCNKAIENEVKYDLDFGKKEVDAGNLKSAKAHYESVIRMLYRDQSNPKFIESKEQLEKVKKQIDQGDQGI